VKRLGREQRHSGVEMRSDIIHRTRPINLNLSSLEQDNALTTLRSLSTTGSSEAMRQQMLDDTFILADIALLGQWTTIYAAPNTGKTLLTLWLLREALFADLIDGDFVFYVNADDNYRGIVEKTEFAEQVGFHLIAPNQNGFNCAWILEIMTELVADKQARGVVIILDTLKKFTDLMQKREATEFGNISRSFVSAGGTLICLAHTNKHKNAEGKSVYSGTSDIRDDSDCAYIIEKVDGKLFEDEVAVEFINDKSRGDVADQVSFSYAKKYGQSYFDLIESVKRIDEGKLSEMKVAASVTKKLEEDSGLIDAICSAIRVGVTTKSALIKNVADETGITHAKIRKVLAERTGAIHALGHRWNCTTGAHNKKEYCLTLPTKSAESK